MGFLAGGGHYFPAVAACVMRSGRPVEGRAIGAGTSSITAFTAPLNTLPHDSTLVPAKSGGTGSNPVSSRPVGYGTWLSVGLSLSGRVKSGPLESHVGVAIPRVACALSGRGVRLVMKFD